LIIVIGKLIWLNTVSNIDASPGSIRVDIIGLKYTIQYSKPLISVAYNIGKCYLRYLKYEQGHFCKKVTHFWHKTLRKSAACFEPVCERHQ
jgi:hypothetical protein